MAIFSKKQEEKKSAKSAAPDKKSVKKQGVDFSAVASAAGVIIAPHVTEKSVALGESVKRGKTSGGQYVFKVYDRVTKPQVRRAVEDAYKVKVTAVRMIAKRDKVRVVRGRFGRAAGYKKALVILKKGDKIEFV